MFDTMKKFCNEGIYVAVYDDSSNVSKFKFGRLLCVDETRFAMLLVSPYGDYDGIVIDDTNDVFRLDSCGCYHDKMAKLFRFCIENYELPSIEPSCIDTSILSFAKETNKIVSIELHESGMVDVTGFIESVSEEVCRVHVVDEYGYDDGIAFVDIGSISHITLDSEDEQRIERLYNANK